MCAQVLYLEKIWDEVAVKVKKVKLPCPHQEGIEGEQRYNSTDTETQLQMQVSGQLTLPGLFTHGQRTLVTTQQEAGWDPESAWKFWRGKKNSCPCWEFNLRLSSP